MAITLKDIATRAGVSVSAVSRCLRNDPKLSLNAETAEKILSIARELGYSRIQSDKDLRLLIIHKENHFADVTNAYYFDIRFGIEEEATKNGYSCRYALYNQLEKEKGEFDAALAIGNYTRKQTEEIIKFSGSSPLVFIGKLSFYPECVDTISYDVQISIEIAMQRLDKANIKDVLFVDVKDNFEIPLHYHKITSVEEYINEHPHMHLFKFIETEVSTSSCAYETLNDYLSKGGKIPDGVFAGNFPIALGLMKALTEHGIIVGRDTSMITIGEEEAYGNWTTPALTMVALRARTMGREAVKRAKARFNNPDLEPAFQSYKIDFIERDSIVDK